MNTQRSAFAMIPILMVMACQTGHAGADDSANQAPPDPMVALMANAKAAQAAADAQAKTETLKYHLRVPANASEQKSLDGACVKGPRDFYTWVGGPAYVKDHADLIQPTWPTSPDGRGESKTMCKMVQTMIAINIKKYTGKADGVNYLKASDPEAAKAIFAQEHNPMQPGQTP